MNQSSNRFALGTFSHDGEARFAALCIGERVIPLRTLHKIASRLGADWGPGVSILELLQHWDRSLPILVALAAEVADASAGALDMSSLSVHPPVDLPRQVFCTGANYRKHVVDLTLDMKVGPDGLAGDALRKWAENMMDERAANGEPYVFTKPISAITGARDPIELPPTTQQPDWELELGVVMGKAARNVSRAKAMDYVAGYSIVNDVSARDLIPRSDYKMLGTDWLRSKGAPTFLPFGPLLVPACHVKTPQDLKLTLKLNGDVMQDESTADMIFGIARQIEYISKHVQLWPGDLICTGSPAGNGTHYGRFLREGDIVESTIEGLGRQRNVCVVPTAAPDHHS